MKCLSSVYSCSSKKFRTYLKFPREKYYPLESWLQKELKASSCLIVGTKIFVKLLECSSVKEYSLPTWMIRFNTFYHVYKYPLDKAIAEAIQPMQKNINKINLIKQSRS